jgi:hypothetical protein
LECPSEDKVLVVLDAEQGRAKALGGLLELVGDVLPADRDIGEDAPERQLGGNARGA